MLGKLMPRDEVLYGADFIQDEVSYNLIHLITESPQNVGLKSLDGRMILAQSPRGNAWLWLAQEVTHEERQNLLQELVRELGEAALPGVTGEPDVAEQFARIYADAHNVACRHHMTMECYHAPIVKRPLHVEGTIRLAAPENTQQVARFLVGFSEDAYGVRANAASQVVAAERLIKQGGLYVWIAGDQTVSMANIAHRSPRHGRINAVYTPRNERKKGYASALVAELGLVLRQDGLVPMLYADQANPDSNRVYRKIGFNRCGTIRDFKFVNHE
ncbi:GNAT family N-acetyltransferase [Paenibacillus glucanolyticus]|jgi:predicted GNAT family acetyltransferase|uniref:GNAT family N-acetyltransferase n=1 Tax=Paenibacillus TaxID=44249 RepID=UPI0003E2AF46|nr:MULTISPECIES: GNAT family N-acetyltransferase [Paenibacillus]ANA79999.1 GCN5 family acetyltransferase [Paenibacillus glucanolyticus]AVV55975.1 GNAT family N-acetyltransferase [Paenibacillus glucanolyticus]ETT38387.1 GCN5-like N-acetyltransferase [Paenibacillus sp. FSL R5-808]OMF69102.1 GNAT family N-acetyltransferase [Paenibacillus glucanolyticus]